MSCDLSRGCIHSCSYRRSCHLCWYRSADKQRSLTDTHQYLQQQIYILIAMERRSSSEIFRCSLTSLIARRLRETSSYLHIPPPPTPTHTHAHTDRMYTHNIDAHTHSYMYIQLTITPEIHTHPNTQPSTHLPPPPPPPPHTHFTHIYTHTHTHRWWP